jgi:WxL domain surface cell wall-binding
MGHLVRMVRRRLARLLGAFVLLTGGIGTPILLTAGTAQAAACSGAVLAGVTCTDAGQLVFTGGNLTFTPPTVFAWAATDTGVDQAVVDTTAGHETIVVNDATGSGAGWNVTASATVFTTGSITLPTTALTVNGSGTLATAGTVPTAACSTATTCTLPTNTVTYPMTILTTAVKIYNAALATGMGSINLGLPGANPMAWWVTVPANQKPGTYNSTITLEVLTAP